MWVDVGSDDQFRDGEMHILEVAGREVGIARWGEEIFAVRNVCPHALAPLCKGHVQARLLPGAGEIGTIDVDSSAPVITCPWHGWEFDLRSGRSLIDSKLRVAAYTVVEKDGRVLVHTGERQRSGTDGPAN